uniref:Ig-like domain-containing protein n=1 Tax=Paramormyrops kingsleyae TaxID=1676925 RepID=A0A3B3Q8W4_9TELE
IPEAIKGNARSFGILCENSLDQIFYIMQMLSLFLEPPSFIEKPQNMEVLPGTNITFSATVGGDPIPTIKWMKGKWRQISHGGRITVEQKGQDAKLEIQALTKSDSGQYRCVASNKHGEIECSTELKVEEKKEAALLEGDLRKYARMYGITDFRANLRKIKAFH